MVRPESVTLNDVAREAEVAVSTASRALSNPDRVSRATREHVQSVARRLGYQQLRTVGPVGRHALLALVVHDITNPYNLGLIRGAEAQARAAGYTLIIADSQVSREFEATHTRRLGTTVDGLIIGGSRQSEDELRSLREQGPVVLFNRQLAGFASVVTDAGDACRQIVEHLSALGHTTLAYLGGPADAWSDGARRRGLTAAAAANGVRMVPLGSFAPTLEQGAAAAEVALATDATAFIAFNDLLAIGMLQRLEKRGVAVPDRISVVGFDDIFGSDFCHPPLTTVTGPVEAAGRTLVDLVLAAVADGPAPETTTARTDPQIVLPSQLRVRDSTGPVR